MVFQGGSCVKTTCRLPLSSCPTNENNGLGNLQVNRNGNLVACLSPCKRWNYPPPYGMNRPESNSPGKEMCCPSPMTPQTCSSGPVVSTQYVKLVRSQCPSAYSYAYDDLAALVIPWLIKLLADRPNYFPQFYSTNTTWVMHLGSSANYVQSPVYGF